MVDDTLKLINSWYTEPGEGGDRPKLLSKLALLELCGWIEGEFDELICAAQDGRLDDLAWVKTNVLEKTSGFTYTNHFRPMLVRVVGEVFARRVEQKMEEDFQGEMDRLKEILRTLWKSRCSFAHADVVANVAAQQVFNAPSWTLDQHRVLKKFIEHYKLSMNAVLQTI